MQKDFELFRPLSKHEIEFNYSSLSFLSTSIWVWEEFFEKVWNGLEKDFSRNNPEKSSH